MALPALRPHEHKQVALQNALSVLNSGAALDRPDTPDEVVTAVRRLPAVEAQYAPFPESIDPRIKAAFEASGPAARLVRLRGRRVERPGLR